MSEKYEWPRIHKAEENIESQVTDWVYDHVMEWFGVDDIVELTTEQIQQVEAFRDELNEYSPMQWGFSNLINNWENETWEEKQENVE